MRAFPSDPDDFFTSDALAPDPIFMGLRALVSASPLGTLRRAVEARDERRERRGWSPGEIVTFPVSTATGRADRTA